MITQEKRTTITKEKVKQATKKEKKEERIMKKLYKVYFKNTIKEKKLE